MILVIIGIDPEPVPPAAPAMSKKASVSKNRLAVLIASTTLSPSSWRRPPRNTA